MIPRLRPKRLDGTGPKTMGTAGRAIKADPRRGGRSPLHPALQPSSLLWIETPEAIRTQ